MLALSQNIKDGPNDITPIAGSHSNTIKNNVVDQKHNSEVCFIGQTTLDNGLTVGLNVQLEANTEADTIDKSYLFLQGPSLGQLIIGDENNAGYLLHVTAPDGGVSLNSGDLVNIQAWINTGISSYFDTPTGTTNLRLTDNDSGKFTYITPRFAGLQAGVSFIPQTEGGGDDNNGSYFVRTPTGSGTEVSAARNKYANGWAGGLNYTQQFGPIGAQASGGAMYFPRSKQTLVTANGSDLFAWNTGLQLAYGGFSVGGAYIQSPNKNTVQSTVTNLNGTAGQNATYSLGGYSWIAGAAYEFGPYKVGLSYMYGKSPGVVSATGPMATHLGDDQNSEAGGSQRHLDDGPGHPPRRRRLRL